MAVLRKIYDPTLIINNFVCAYVPNSLRYFEGLGEQKVRVQTGGGGSIQQVLTEDITKRQTSVKFKVEPTAQNIDFLRAIKSNMDGHVVTISAPDLTRTITGAILVTNYEVGLGMDEEIEVEFVGNAAQ